MKKEIKEILVELKKMMDEWSYPIEEPIELSFIESIINKNLSMNLHPMLTSLRDELCLLFHNQPEYLTFLEQMDGFEYNGLILFSLSIPEPSVKNLFIMNEFYRDNDGFINPELSQRLVIGNDSISLFTYDSITNFFEIRDNVATENVFGSFDNFSDFLKEILDTVK